MNLNRCHKFRWVMLVTVMGAVGGGDARGQEGFDRDDMARFVEAESAAPPPGAEGEAGPTLESLFTDPAARDLARAAGDGDVEEVARLAQAGADVNAAGEDGITPLMWALSRESLAGFTALLEQGADPNRADDAGVDAVAWAAAVGGPFLDEALKHGGEAGATPGGVMGPAHFAAGVGRVESLQKLADAGADLNVADGQRLTPLAYAAAGGSREAVEWLLDHGATVADPEVASPLTLAELYGHDEIASLLRAAMDRVTADQVFDDARVVELAEAAAAGDRAAVERLAAAGVEVDAQGLGGMTPLLWALRSRNAEGMGALLDAGADANAALPDGNTAVTLAATMPEERVLRVLLAGGGDVDRAGPFGQTPLMLAAQANRLAQVKQLLAADADVTLTDEAGDTALHSAIIFADAAVVQQLLDAGADAQAENKLGVAPANLAVNRPEVAKLLEVE